MDLLEKSLKLLETKQQARTAEPFSLNYVLSEGDRRPFAVMIFQTKDEQNWATSQLDAAIFASGLLFFY